MCRHAPRAIVIPVIPVIPVMRSIGHYEILGEIGRGGMGIVYLARQRGLEREVALKELQGVHASDPDIVQRFVRESRLASSLNDTNIVTVHDYIEEEGASYIAMEYMPRGSLRPWTGELTIAQLVGVLEGVLAGLAAVAPAGIVHRDLKPENLMISREGRVKIADFGIAKATRAATVSSFVTATGVTIGTPAYMAPEQALERAIGPWTDLYSVGIMTYEQLVGRLPFHDSATPMALLLRHVNEPVPPVRDSRPDLDHSLSEWVARLLVKEPAKRTPSAAQAWEELEEIAIELLGPRWRREARLPERSAAASAPTPLTPAPFHSLAQPELESGFRSYGRAPTGMQTPGAPSAQASSQPTPPPPADAGGAPPDGRDSAKQAPRVSRGRPDARGRWRLLGAAVLLIALTATAGFALAPASEGPARSGAAGLTAGAQLHAASRTYAATLSGVVAKLNHERAHAGTELARARNAPAQAAAAERLAQAHARAAISVRNANPASAAQAANRALATALAAVGSAYAGMASAARHEDRHGFDSARTAVARDTAALGEALAQLHKLGYPLAG